MTKKVFLFALIALVVLLAGCQGQTSTGGGDTANEEQRAQINAQTQSGADGAVSRGEVASVEYVGKLENGTVFDSSAQQGQPLQVQVGAGQVIPGFENALVGMGIGDTKNITLQPSQAYGPVRDELIRDIPADQFGGQNISEGMRIAVATSSGRQLPATITGVGVENVTIDLNHPLAGETLNFDIEVVDIQE